MKNGNFITIEGNEGCGKSSVINFLEKFLKDSGYTVMVFREPGSTRIGEKIREILLNKENHELSPHTELLLYLAARTQLIEEKLKGALKIYNFVVCDRFFDSTLVYQGIGLDLKKITPKAVKLFSLNAKPDLTILLDIKPADGLKRIHDKDRIESRPINFHERIRNGYLNLAKKNSGRIKVINASCTLAEIYPKVERVVKTKFKLNG